MPTISYQFEAAYEQDIDRWIIGACEAGAQDFWDMVSKLPAVYPTVVREALQRLIAASSVPDYLAVENATWNFNSAFSSEVPGLPTPNPLTFDWRYTSGTAGELLERIVASTHPSGAVGLLGSPSVYKMAAIRRVSRQFILLDQSNSLSFNDSQPLAGSVFRRGDVQDSAIDQPLVQAVIADPPWYERETLSFLGAAARICTDQSKVLLSWAPWGVRPGIKEERQRLIERAKELGLRFLGSEGLVLTYATPFFEYNALRAAGFAQVMPNWRRGDLLIFERTGDSLSGPINPTAPGAEWEQFELCGVTIWVRPKAHQGFSDPILQPLIEGDILPTVSRRDNRREAADVWTAGNRVYRCEGTNILSIILHALSTSKAPLEAVQLALQHPLDHLEAARVGTSIAQIERMVQAESQEMRSFTDGRD